MTLRMVARTSGALWLLPLLLAIGVWIGSTSIWERSGYATSDLAETSVQLIYVGPITAAYLAFRLPRYLRVMADARPRRGRVAALLHWWGLIILGAPAIGVIAMLIAARALPDAAGAWWLLGVAFAAVLGCAAIGALAARSLPVVVGVPLVGIGAFVWFAYPDAGDSLLLRNLDSNFEGCCWSTGTPELGSLVGSVTLTMVVVLCGLGIVLSRWWEQRQRPAALAAAVLVCASALGLGAVAAEAMPGRLDSNSHASRTTHTICSARGDHRVCVWPENSGTRGQLLDLLVSFDRDVRRSGLAPVTFATEKPVKDPSALVVARWLPHPSRAHDLEALVSAYAERATRCGRPSTLDLYPRTRTLLLVGLVSGQTPDQISAEGYQWKDIRAVQEILTRPTSEIRAWFDKHACSGHDGTGR